MISVTVFFGVVKIALILFFLLNVGAILTWAERRQMSMIQDRIGPNRAVVYLPAAVVKGLLAVLGVGLGAGAAAYAFVPKHAPAAMLGVGFGLFEVGVLVTWLALLVVHGYARRAGTSEGPEGAIGRIQDPRVLFYGGLVAHALVAGAFMALQPEALHAGRPFLSVAAGYTALVFAASGLWASTKVGEGKVGVRLAGLLHPLADGLKFITKEHFQPPNADKFLHGLGPLIALFPAFVTFAVIPFGDTLCVRYPTDGSFFHALANLHVAPVVASSGVCAEQGVSLQIADLNVGILYLFAMAGTGIIGAAIAGWSSDNKFSLLGGLRAASQMVSYEVAMGLALVGAFMVYGTVRLDDMVRWQGEHTWGIFVQPLAFFLFFAAAIAEQKRVPFDAPEGESEIVAGYFLEYSGMQFSMFMLGEYLEVVVSSALLTTVFLGGWELPFLHRDGITVAFGDTVVFTQRMAHLAVVIAGALAFFGKVLLLCWFQLFIRWTLPRFRYDQIMKLGWKILLPAALVNMMLTGLVVLAIDQAGTGVSDALQIAADVTQGLVVLAGAGLFVWLVSGIVKPAQHKRLVVTSSAKYADADGGVKTAPMQA